MKYKRISKPLHLKDHTPSKMEAVPYMIEASGLRGGVCSTSATLFTTPSTAATPSRLPAVCLKMLRYGFAKR